MIVWFNIYVNRCVHIAVLSFRTNNIYQICHFFGYNIGFTHFTDNYCTWTWINFWLYTSPDVRHLEKIIIFFTTVWQTLGSWFCEKGRNFFRSYVNITFDLWKSPFVGKWGKIRTIQTDTMFRISHSAHNMNLQCVLHLDPKMVEIFALAKPI